MFFQRQNIAVDGVGRHFSRLFQIAAIGNAAGQGRHHNRVAAFRFGPEDYIVLQFFLFHGFNIADLKLMANLLDSN